MFAFALVATMRPPKRRRKSAVSQKAKPAKYKTSGCTALAIGATEEKFEWYPAYIGGL